MKNWQWQRPEKADFQLLGLYWVFGVLFSMPYYFRGGVPLWKFIVEIAQAMIMDTGFALLFALFIFPNLLRERRVISLFLSALLVLVISGFLYSFFMAGLYDKYYEILFREGGLNGHYILNNIMSQALNQGLMIAILIGRKYFVAQNQLLVAQKAQKESELNQLRSQVDPHFLFNNLNILDVLIETNPTEARQFLKRLSALYRYLLRHKDADVVELSEELAFADDYIYLLQSRFGEAYQFKRDYKITNTTDVFLPPGALQTLLENAVKHNQGSDKNPVIIHMTVTQKNLQVENKISPKLQTPEGTGTGLENLSARYTILTDKNIEISQNGTFSVTIPLIELVE